MTAASNDSTILNATTTPTLPRSQHLKTATMATHDVRDMRSMASSPFDNPHNDARYLQAQYAFLRRHGHVEAFA